MKKNKLKTRKSALKRFKVTATGKILHRAHGSRHLKSIKSKSRRRRHKRLKEISSDNKLRIKRILGL